MLMLPLSEDWPVLLGAWPAPCFQPYVFAALHAALLLVVFQVVLLVFGRNILVSPWLLALRLSPSASPTAFLRLFSGKACSKEKKWLKSLCSLVHLVYSRQLYFWQVSCPMVCSTFLGSTAGVFVLVPAIEALFFWLVLDVARTFVLDCFATATELLLQQAAAASCGGAFQGILKLDSLFFWLVLDVARTFVLECFATATELLLQRAAAASALPDVFALVAHYIFLVGKEFVTVSYREVGHTTASSLTVGNGEQASGRVDVPGGGLQLSSAASQVFGKVPGHSETEHEVHQINCGIGENATFQSWSNN